MRKRGLVLVVMLGIVLLLTNITQAFQNEPEGFRGLKWGDPPTEDMQHFEAVSGSKGYTLPDDKMSLGNAKFYRIVYCFYGEPGRFFGVMLSFKGEDNYDLLEMICEERFGTDESVSFHSPEGWQRLSWLGRRSQVLLRYDLVEKEGYLYICSTVISQEMEAAERRKEAEKAAGDF